MIAISRLPGSAARVLAAAQTAAAARAHVRMGKFGQDSSLQVGLRLSTSDAKIGADSDAQKAASERARLAATSPGQPTDRYRDDDEELEAQCFCIAILAGLLCCLSGRD
jgi:hypothetical protein